MREGLTTPAMLGLNGGSAGGFLAGRAVTERPDLFGAVAIEAGVADLVRFVHSNAGPVNTHHVASGAPYPATLFYAPFNDARVAPWHAAKFAAALRAAEQAAAPAGAGPRCYRWRARAAGERQGVGLQPLGGLRLPSSYGQTS